MAWAKGAGKYFQFQFILFIFFNILVYQKITIANGLIISKKYFVIMVIDYPNYFKEKKKIETSRASYSKSVALMHQTTLTVSLYSISSELPAPSYDLCLNFAISF